jgi:hypothetical protein
VPCPEQTAPAVARARALQALGVLAELAAVWAPLGASCGAVRDALGGGEGVTSAQLQQLVRVAARWQRLEPRLRGLYLHGLQAGLQAAPVALWQLLLARRPRHPPALAVRQLEQLWLQLYGYPCSIEVTPIHHARGGDND